MLEGGKRNNPMFGGVHTQTHMTHTKQNRVGPVSDWENSTMLFCSICCDLFTPVHIQYVPFASVFASLEMTHVHPALNVNGINASPPECSCFR